ncbi:hypothetical protein PFAG_02599, partial [Plasmodium falciparum Santa Lucia]
LYIHKHSTFKNSTHKPFEFFD